MIEARFKSSPSPSTADNVEWAAVKELLFGRGWVMLPIYYDDGTLLLQFNPDNMPRETERKT